MNPNHFKDFLTSLNAKKVTNKENTYSIGNNNDDGKLYFKSPSNNKIELDLLITNPEKRGTGIASNLLRQFLTQTDEYQYKVFLYLSPRDKTTDLEKLTNLYYKFGFNQISDFEMIRNPKIKKTIKEEAEEKPKIRIKKQHINNLLTYTPFYGEERMGSFRLEKFNNDFKIFGSVLYDKFRGSGLGKKFYKYIITDLSKTQQKLFSDNNMTNDARNIWDWLVANNLAEKTPQNTYISKV
jgi:predicted GNAT family acetyltransferase